MVGLIFSTASCRDSFVAASDSGRKYDQQEGTLTTCYEVNRYLLETYTTDDVIDEAEGEITNFKQSIGFFTLQYSQAIFKTIVKFCTVFCEPSLKALLVERLFISIRNQVRNNGGGGFQDVILKNVRFHATIGIELQNKAGPPNRNLQKRLLVYQGRCSHPVYLQESLL